MKTLFASFVVVALISNIAIAQQHQQNGQHQLENEQNQVSKLTDADYLQIAVQKICPVMGGELGSMGEPIKVKMGDQYAYLCCKGCLGKQPKAEHWKTIQANIAKAQGTCPIMGKPVSADMKSTVVNGQQIFVCCPPCIEKIQADPQTALTKVNASYVSFVEAGAQAKSDQLHVAAQGICPVSGQKLGSMGHSYQSQSWRKRTRIPLLQSLPKQTTQRGALGNRASQLGQGAGICPVMGKPVSADMKSTVVNGRKIFVCCPPCIEKINADPSGFVAKLDAQIAANQAVGHDHSVHEHASSAEQASWCRDEMPTCTIHFRQPLLLETETVAEVVYDQNWLGG